MTHSDCFAFLAEIQRESIPLAIVDPPYNLSKAEWDTFSTHSAFLEFTYKWIDALLPTLSPNGSLYVFNTPFNSAFICAYLVSKGMVYRNWITWDKRDGFVGGSRRFAPTQETILYFSRSERPTFNSDDVRIPYESKSRIAHAMKKGILKDGKRWFPNANGKLCNDVWHIVSDRHKRKIAGKVVRAQHATPKPEELIERIVLASSNPGDVILDCFAGTGTTAAVALRNGRRFIGCESDAKFVELANERIAHGRR